MPQSLIFQSAAKCISNKKKLFKEDVNAKECQTVDKRYVLESESDVMFYYSSTKHNFLQATGSSPNVGPEEVM